MEETKGKKRKHIKNYYKARRTMREYFKKWRNTVLQPFYEETPEQLQQRQKEYLKDCDKEEKLWMARLEAADGGGEVYELEFHVTWGRNYEGSQAKCEGFVFYTDPEYGSKSSHSNGKRTGGGGYDKYSEAIQYCIDRFDEAGTAALDRWVIESGEKLWKEYAVYRKPFPHFDFGGKGGQTFTRLFKPLGYTYGGDWPLKNFVIDEDRRSDKYDFIRIVRRDRL